MTDFRLSRRETFVALGGAGAIAALPAYARAAVAPAPATEAEAGALLDSLAENLLILQPESATSLGAQISR